MKRRRHQAITAAAAAAVLAIHADARAVTYTSADSFSLNSTGFTVSQATGIFGTQQVGYGLSSNNTDHAILWNGPTGTAVDLNPTGFTNSFAYGIANGQEVGYGNVTGTVGAVHALLWTGSASKFVDLNPVGFTSSHALATSGVQQVGDGYGTPTGGNDHALLWSGTATGYVDLNPSGYTQSQATAISGMQQVGEASGTVTSSNENAVLWTGTAAGFVNLNPSGFTESIADGISGGQEVGSGYGTSTLFNQNALLWTGTAGSAVNLNPTNFTQSEALATNSVEQVGDGFGTATASNVHALVWSGAAASVVDLNNLIPGSATFSYATGIDFYGNITGFAESATATYAVEWLAGDTYSTAANATAWNSAATWLSGIPAAGNDVLLISSDGAARTITYTNPTPSLVLGTLTIDATNGGSMTLSQLQNNLNAAAVYVGGSTISAGGTGVLTVNNTGQLSVAGAMKVWNHGRANLNGTTAAVGSLSIVGNGIVNLNGSLTINFGAPANDSISTIVGYLQSGYNGGAWTGTSGIISTSAAATTGTATLGYLDGNIDTGLPAVAPNQIVVKYALVGDANLDGVVNFADFASVLKNFGQPGTDWAQGNFTYNPNSPSIQGTNFTDFADVLKNFLQPFPGGGGGESLGGATISSEESAQIQTAVVQLPEPGAIGLGLCVAMGALARRRRRPEPRKQMPLKRILASCVLLDGLGQLARAQAAVNFTINAQQNVQPISPFIYGVNQNLPGYNNPTYFRLGGDRWTAYNWVTNASNAGSDYNYSNDDYLGGGSTPGGAVMPTLSNAYSLDAGTLLTIPMNGLVSADENGPVNINDPTRFTTRFKPEEPAKNAPFTLTPDPNAPVVYEDEFVNWVKTNYPYGTTDPNRPISFELDNEPDSWSTTHPEVHPNAVTYAELLSDTIAYSTAIKNVEPNALIYGPVNFGWPGMVSLNNASDSGADGNFLDYYLSQMNLASQKAGKRLVDVLDIHWYPVAGGIQAPRSLWDPTYNEDDYITQYYTNGPIELIPRLQAQIAQYYPGTKISISEYNYGSGTSITGAIMEADALGIFGKEGLYSANEWELLSNENYIGAAFNMFRDYDGNGGTFGNVSVSAVTSDVADTSVYASLDSANPYHMVLVAINKTAAAISTAFSFLQSQAFAQAEIYQLTGAAANPVFAGTVGLTNSASMAYTMPASSVSTINLLSFPTWIAPGGATWAAAADWSNGTIPNQAGAVANFTGNITTASTVNLNTAWTVGTVNFSNAYSYTLAGGSGGKLTLDNGGATATAALTDNGGNHFITAPLTLNSNLLASIVNSADSLTLSAPISGGRNLTVSGNGTLRFGQGVGTPTFTAVTVNTGATLDITTNAVAINYGSPGNSPITSIVTALTRGYNNGTWTGTGITSSAAAAGGSTLAVGYGEGNADAGRTSAAPNQVLIKYTLVGDANLDGVVNFTDFATVLKYFGQGGTDWARGNFTYAANSPSIQATNFTDFADVLKNFLQPFPGGGAGETLGGTIQPLTTTVQILPPVVSEVEPATPALPEPTGLSLAAGAAVGLLARRRRRLLPVLPAV